MSADDNDKRLNDILEMIGRVAALDFSEQLHPSDKNDMIDAISLGLNMLSEELSTNVVERSKMDEVNSKLERFAFSTAHDLKSPLNAIIGLANLIELSLDSDDPGSIALYVSMLKKTSEDMKSLVHGILDYSRADAAGIEKEDIDLNIVVQEIVETDRLKDHAEIHFLCELPVIYFNRSAIGQVIRNLLANAVKYSDKPVCTIHLDAVDREDHFLISISDNGPGIEQEHHERIFELFNKIDVSAKKGSHGIGLATVKRILESEQERIWVESTPGAGATFYFTMQKHRKSSV